MNLEASSFYFCFLYFSIAFRFQCIIFTSLARLSSFDASYFTFPRFSSGPESSKGRIVMI